MNPVGRPTKYNDELVAMAQAYVDGEWIALGDTVPSIASMACYLGVRRETLHAWSKDGEHKEFSNIFEAALALQERELINKSLSKDFDSGMSKMLLSKHGYSDKQEIDHTTAGQPLRPSITITTTDPIEAARQYRDIMSDDR